jgi:hypothetical protein
MSDYLRGISSSFATRYLCFPTHAHTIATKECRLTSSTGRVWGRHLGFTSLRNHPKQETRAKPHQQRRKAERSVLIPSNIIVRTTLAVIVSNIK